MKKFLTDRYSARVATKLVAVFDFSTVSLDYKNFYKQLIDYFINQEMSDVDIIDISRQFAFNIYDMNCDGYVDHNDLFSFIKDVRKDDILN